MWNSYLKIWSEEFFFMPFIWNFRSMHDSKQEFLSNISPMVVMESDPVLSPLIIVTIYSPLWIHWQRSLSCILEMSYLEIIIQRYPELITSKGWHDLSLLIGLTKRFPSVNAWQWPCDKRAGQTFSVSRRGILHDVIQTEHALI